MGEDLAGSLQDLLSNAVALEGSEWQDLGDDEEDEAHNCGYFHD